ncbi:MAG: hypothetical protein AAGI69_23685 [Cyanobacteria bacterium P01_H01_bin.21]
MKPSFFNCCIGLITGLTVSLSCLAKAQAAALEFDLANPPATRATAQPTRPVALMFTPDRNPIQTPETPALDRKYSLDRLFEGGTASLVARAVGSAEGTRTPSGGYTSAYYGHVDPGNGVWNLGSFSYQHGASSPEQADDKQLRRLQKQAGELRRQTDAKSLELSLIEELNGIDLANQAPLAALDRGYIDWLNQAQTMELDNPVVWARTKAFINPDTGYWDAPGLGNTWHTIYYDQLRRYDAIARALEAAPPTPLPMQN